MNMKAYLKGALAVLACTAGIAAHAQKKTIPGRSR